MKKFLIILTFLAFTSSGVQSQEKAALIISGENSENKAAIDFFSKDIPLAITIAPEDLKKKHALDDIQIAWIHDVDSRIISGKLLENLKGWVTGGGRLILSLSSADLVVPLCGETIQPTDSLKPVKDDGYGRRLGLHAFIYHPVFEGLHGGAYLQRPVRDTSVMIYGWFGENVPSKGRVIATDWDYIFLRESSKLMAEYKLGKGKVIVVGAYMNFSLPNYNHTHLELFTRNVFSYLMCDTCSSGDHYWDYEKPVVTECVIPESDILVARPPESRKWEIADDPLAMKNRFATENFWDVAGERILTMGSEKAGIDEVWSHPFMAFRDYEVGIKFAYKDSVLWLKDERPEIEVHPGFFMRTYKFSRAYLKEIIVNDPSEPAGVVHYEYNGVYEAEIFIRFKTNLRLMWPYSEAATGSLCSAWDNDLETFYFQNQSGMSSFMLGANRTPEQHSVTPEKNVISASLSYKLKMTDKIDVAFAAGTDGYLTTKMLYRSVIADPFQIFLNSGQHTKELLNEKLIISTPDENFNKGYRWALLATDRFFVNTPGMGRSLVAGYSTTSRGWDGGHAVNGRPGYGWYFGRDGEWSGLAMVDYGDFEKVRSMLQFFAKYQDLSGKIFHEATTSGVIHYDASDATPLYIVLWGRYFRHTNDTAYLRESWTSIKKAINFCFSTDTDNDHLIEITNIGHGWVEGGELYGSHATMYLAGCWHAALNEAYVMASAIGDPEAESYEVEQKALSKIINERFWDNNNNFFGYGINKDGKLRKEPTILPAVPMYFGIPQKEKARFVLSQYASNAFTTNWGTRILREDSKLFKPTGYHYGSVWPLFTGWASLAEYKYDNDVQGFSHIMNNLNIYKNWGLGFAEEVLNGAEYQPSGVCPHQCWSETMVLLPAIEGMLGFDADATKNEITLAPAIPAGWDSLSVTNIRCGETKVGFRMNRKDGRYHYTFSGKARLPLTCVFNPSLPSGTRITKATINGKPLQITTFTNQRGVIASTRFSFEENTEIIFEYENGISVLPILSAPKPGDAAEGTRIIDYGLFKASYYIDVEGLSGTTALIEVYVNGQQIKAVSEAEIVKNDAGKNKVILQVRFDAVDEKYVNKKITLDLK